MKPLIELTLFQDFGVYSPDFEGKVVDHTNYQYKRNLITRNSIRPDVNDDQNWGIDVWELESHSFNLKPLEQFVLFGNQFDYPICDGYENYTTPRWISEKMMDWKKQESYTNKNDLQMYLTYNYNPKSIGSVQYEFYNPHSTNGNQAFIVLWNEVGNYPLASGIDDPYVIQAKDELQNLADNISLHLPL